MAKVSIYGKNEDEWQEVRIDGKSKDKWQQ
jgi:hypothetical protein